MYFSYAVKKFPQSFMIACFNLILKCLACFLIVVYCQRKLILGMLETYSLRWVTLSSLGHLSIWDLWKALGGLGKPPMHILLELYSCREVELPRADPLKYIASWLMSFVWPVLLSTLIMLLTMDQSYFFYIQILDSLNIWVIFK